MPAAKVRRARSFLFFGLSSAAICSLAAAKEEPLFFGSIPVQYAAPNDEIVLDLHRFLHPPGATVKVDGALFDPATFSLRVKAPSEQGVQTFRVTAELEKQQVERILVIASQSQPKTRITFKPAKPVSRLTIAGSFNGWNRNAQALTGPDENGVYAIDLALAPGRHAYKFAVDGAWVLDPNNQVTEDDGMGGKNSVLVVEDQSVAPTIYADRLENDRLILRSVEEGVENFVVIADSTSGDRLLEPEKSGHGIDIPVPSETQSVRIIGSTAAGVCTNVVSCPLKRDPHFDWHDALLYYALTDRFADGDKSNDNPIEDAHVSPPANYHGGDLRGIRDKIEQGYFTKLGVNSLWIAPLNRNPAHACQESPEPHRWYTGYHGYWPISPTEIDPHVGSAGELHALIDTAHAHGIEVIADLVLHHVHDEHPWWKQHRDWFGKLELPDGRKNLRLWDEKQFTTWFEPYLPSFDFSKDAPVHALIDNTVWWAKQYQLDGFRLDAVKHILPSFWWKFRSALREQVEARRGAPLYLVGETFKDRSGIDAFVGPNMLDGQFDFPLYDSIKDAFGTGSGSLSSLDDAITSSERAYGKGVLMSPLIGNHDKGRFMAYADGELPDPAFKKEEEVGWQKPPQVHDPANYSKLELAQSFLLSLDGVPMIYYGDEIGMTGAGDPDNRRDMRFGDAVNEAEKDVLETFCKLSELRRTHPALRFGSRRTLLRENDCLAFVRAYFDDRVLVVFNRSHAKREIVMNVPLELAGRQLLDVRTGNQLNVDEGRIKVNAAPVSYLFVVSARK